MLIPTLSYHKYFVIYHLLLCYLRSCLYTLETPTPMKYLMSNDPRHEISRSTGGHFKRRHKRSPHRSRDVPLSLHWQHRQCSLHIPLRGVHTFPKITEFTDDYLVTFLKARGRRYLLLILLSSACPLPGNW
jgi:hypothetical protein